MTKSNLAAMPEALAYRLVTDERHGVARVVWDGATAHTAADLLRAPSRDDDQAPARSEAERFLLELLTDAPMRSRMSSERPGRQGSPRHPRASPRSAGPL